MGLASGKGIDKQPTCTTPHQLSLQGRPGCCLSGPRLRAAHVSGRGEQAGVPHPAPPDPTPPNAPPAAGSSRTASLDDTAKYARIEGRAVRYGQRRTAAAAASAATSASLATEPDARTAALRAHRKSAGAGRGGQRQRLRPAALPWPRDAGTSVAASPPPTSL